MMTLPDPWKAERDAALKLLNEFKTKFFDLYESKRELHEVVTGEEEGDSDALEIKMHGFRHEVLKKLVAVEKAVEAVGLSSAVLAKPGLVDDPAKYLDEVGDLLSKTQGAYETGAVMRSSGPKPGQAQATPKPWDLMKNMGWADWVKLLGYAGAALLAAGGLGWKAGYWWEYRGEIKEVKDSLARAQVETIEVKESLVNAHAEAREAKEGLARCQAEHRAQPTKDKTVDPPGNLPVRNKVPATLEKKTAVEKKRKDNEY